MDNNSSEPTTQRLDVLVGDNVEIRTRYQTGQWAHGYEVVDVVLSGYRICRRGSRELLPDIFGPADVRLDGEH